MGFTLDFLTTGILFVNPLVASAKMNTTVAAVCSCQRWWANRKAPIHVLNQELQEFGGVKNSEKLCSLTSLHCCYLASPRALFGSLLFCYTLFICCFLECAIGLRFCLIQTSNTGTAEIRELNEYTEHMTSISLSVESPVEQSVYYLRKVY